MNKTEPNGFTLSEHVFLAAAYWYALGKGEYSNIARFFSEDYVMMMRETHIVTSVAQGRVKGIQEYYDTWADAFNDDEF